MTVPRSLMKQAPRMPLAEIRLVEAGFQHHRVNHRHRRGRKRDAAQQTRLEIPAQQIIGDGRAAEKRREEPTRPTTVTSVSFLRMTSGSSSAPARKVSRMAPAEARNFSHSIFDPKASAAPKYPATAAHDHADTDFDQRDGDPQMIGDNSGRNGQPEPESGDGIDMFHGGVLPSKTASKPWCRHKKSRFAAGCFARTSLPRPRPARRSHQPGLGG